MQEEEKPKVEEVEEPKAEEVKKDEKGMLEQAREDLDQKRRFVDGDGTVNP